MGANEMESFESWQLLHGFRSKIKSGIVISSSQIIHIGVPCTYTSSETYILKDQCWNLHGFGSSLMHLSIQRECIVAYNKYRLGMNNILEGHTNIGQELKIMKRTKSFIMGYWKCS